MNPWVSVFSAGMYIYIYIIYACVFMYVVTFPGLIGTMWSSG